MSLGTHAAIGAIIASRFPEHPVLAFCLAFLSHFALDAIPHWDYKLITLEEKENELDTRMPINMRLIGDLLRIGTDIMIGVVVALFIPVSGVFIILLGAFGGILPDFLQFAYFQFPRQPLLSLQRFHLWVHTKNKMKHHPILSILSQIALVSVAMFLVR